MIATSLCQSAGRYSLPHGILKPGCGSDVVSLPYLSCSRLPTPRSGRSSTYPICSDFPSPLSHRCRRPADVTLHLEVIRTIGEHRPIQELATWAMHYCSAVSTRGREFNRDDTAPPFPYSHRRGGGFGFCGSEFGGEARPSSPLNAL